MIVGFTILDYKGYEKEAVEFIRKMCILESADVAQNIIDSGPGINIFSSSVTYKDLAAQPFLTTPIEVQDGECLLVSGVNFNIEIPYEGDTLRLVPTEYIRINPNRVSYFKDFIAQGIVKVIPDTFLDGQKWILDEGYWEDAGVWVDNKYWKD